MPGVISQSAAAALVLMGSANAALYNKVIETQSGPVVGYQAFNSSPAGYNWTNYQEIAVFKGIPFAASPAGKNRFKPPQPVTKWNSTFYASDFGDACVGGSFDSGSDPESENCLNLNVYTPANSSDAKLPVVMWSYPAGGSNRQALFTGGGMAHAGVVFVNYNYRNGAFGWLAHPELSEEFEAVTGHNSSGNWAMLDQFAALKWIIRENIAAFGGDPDRITVQGQSAGSAATYHILNSPLTKGEIVGAIIESGVRDPHEPKCTTLAEGYSTLAENLAQGVKFLRALNISSIEEARQVPYETLVDGSSEMYSWSATLDGYAMPSTYLESLLNGAANQVPVITGNTKDESGATYGLNISLETYLQDNNETYSGEWSQRFFDLYPANGSTTASGAENSQYTDRSKAGTYLWSRTWQRFSSQPVHNYYWNHAPPGQDQGAYHESEINYVLNNLYGTDLPWEPADYTIAEQMNGYWVNLIKTGNPNGDGLVNWPAVTQIDEAMVQVVGDSFGQEPVVDKEKLELFEEWFAALPAYSLTEYL